LPGAKALASSFAMSRFAGDPAPGKTPGKRTFAKVFCILPGSFGSNMAKYNISCSDDSDDEVENESGKHACAFAGWVMSDAESYEEELSYEELAISYHELMVRNVDLDQMLEKQG